jgi:general secretion pathway protein G
MKHTQTQHRHSTSGFTLVEMVLVLGIVALLVGAGIVSLRSACSIPAKKPRVQGRHLTTLSAALRSYEVDNMFLPTTSKACPHSWKSPAPVLRRQSWRRQAEKAAPRSLGQPLSLPPPRHEGQRRL